MFSQAVNRVKRVNHKKVFPRFVNFKEGAILSYDRLLLMTVTG